MYSISCPELSTNVGTLLVLGTPTLPRTFFGLLFFIFDSFNFLVFGFGFVLSLVDLVSCLLFI